MLPNQPAPVRFFDYRFSGNGYKVRLALAQLGLDVEVIPLDLLKGETRSPEFLLKNPMGQIPVLELDDGTYLRESNAILYWLAEDSFLMPSNSIDRALVLQWMFFEQSNIDKVLGRTRFLKAHPEFREVHSYEWQDWCTVGHGALAVLDSCLEKGSYLVSESYSVADICLYGYVHSAEEGGFSLGSYPHLLSWIDRVKATHGYFPQMEGDYP